MQSVAQGWLVYSLTGSPFYLGLVAAAGTLPILLFTFAGGIAADMYSKRNLLLLTQALSILPALILGILTDLKVVAVWQVAVVAAMLGTINALDIPVRQSFMMELVGRGSLTNAIALNSAAFHGARIIGPVIAGVAIGTLGLAACFYLNAASFLAVIFALYKISTRGMARTGAVNILANFREGIDYIRRSPEIFRIIVLLFVFSLAGIPFITLLPVFAGETFRIGAQGFGFLVGATGAGALIAALSIAFRRDIVDKHRFMAVSALCFSVALLFFSISRNLYLALFLLVFAGWGLVSFMATANSFIQLAVPDGLRGRAMSVYTFVFLGTAPLGNSILGTAADYFGTSEAIAAGAMLCTAGTVIFSLKSAGVRRYSRRP
jgi:MFS family permease